ncbi:Na+/H+ antiporter subunit E [candidate division FCPU426 bacterium]|nr:Na+/H+ antiporter subunit E [candidate division FCPU426 bacterium]
MRAFFLTAVLTYIAYLILTAGSWTIQELVAGGILAVIVASLTYGFQFRIVKAKHNPLRILYALFYLVIPFLTELTKANIDVAIRVFTGKIRPGIIKYNPRTRSDFGTMLIANSITLTPGTLTVHVDEKSNDLYVHVLNIAPGAEEKDVWTGKDLFSFFDLSAWVRRITE